MKLASVLAILGVLSAAAEACPQKSPYKETGMLEHPEDEVQALAFSPDGKQLAVATTGGLHLWNPNLNKKIRSVNAHPWPTICLAFSADGKRIVTGSRDRTAKIWEAETFRELRTLTGHTDHVTAVAISPDGKIVATGGRDYQLKWWDAESGKLLKSHKTPGMVSSLSFRPKGRILFSGHRAKDLNIKIWDLQTGEELDPLEEDVPEALQGLGSEEMKKRLAEIEKGRQEAIERIKKTEADPKKQEEEIAKINEQAKAESENLFGDERTFRELRWELFNILNNTGKSTQYGGVGCRLPNEEVLGISYFDGGKRMAASGAFGTIHLWDLDSPEVDKSLGSVNLACGINCFGASPDGKWLACGGSDYPDNPYFVRIVDGVKGKLLETFLVHSAVVKALAFSPDGKYLASGALDGQVFVWTHKKK